MQVGMYGGLLGHRVLDLGERHVEGEFGGDVGQRIARRLRRKRRTTAETRVHLQDNTATAAAAASIKPYTHTRTVQAQ